MQNNFQQLIHQHCKGMCLEVGLKPPGGNDKGEDQFFQPSVCGLCVMHVGFSTGASVCEF